MPSHEDFVAAKAEMAKRFLSKAAQPSFLTFAASATTKPTENVVGVGVGMKISEDKETSTKCVRFYVAEKIHKDALNSKSLLPREVGGLPTDVIATGRFKMLGTAEDNKKRVRPIRPGTSIGFKFPPPQQNTVMAGTFGAVVSKGGKKFILSNNHVLSENGLIAIGSDIFQPGLLDGGNAATDKVAKLSVAIPIKKSGSNKVDCAIAEILSTVAVNARHMPSVGKLSSTNPIAAANQMKVMKTGRTTGHRNGTVVDVNADVTVPYTDASGVEFIATFTDQIMIVGTPAQPFSAGGDSGSLIVDRASKRACGLLFAGSATHTIGNHIADVLAALGVTLETA